MKTKEEAEEIAKSFIESLKYDSVYWELKVEGDEE